MYVGYVSSKQPRGTCACNITLSFAQCEIVIPFSRVKSENMTFIWCLEKNRHVCVPELSIIMSSGQIKKILGKSRLGGYEWQTIFSFDCKHDWMLCGSYSVVGLLGETGFKENQTTEWRLQIKEWATGILFTEHINERHWAYFFFITA